MKIQLSPSCLFNLDFTLCCGQAFRWNRHSEWWYGVVGKKVFKVRQAGKRLEFENADEDFVRDYFGLSDDLLRILSQIGKDSHIVDAVSKFKGLHILRQDPWECLISYVCATYKSILAIRRMLLDLSRRFGERICYDNHIFYTFPTSARLAAATDSELVDCGLGYRAKYVSATARLIHASEPRFEDLRKATYDEARTGLLDFPGVGPKVADCVLLFSLGKLQAFPVDVWIRRVILRHYSGHFSNEFVKKISGERSLSDSEYDRLNLFGREYFGEYAGYAQEYLYHYERIQR